MEQSFINAKHFINHFILFAMKMREKSVTIYNRVPQKKERVEKEVDVNDDSDVDIEKEKEEKEKEEREESFINEYFLSPELEETMRKHYEALYFTWNSIDGKITIIWE